MSRLAKWVVLAIAVALAVDAAVISPKDHNNKLTNSEGFENHAAFKRAANYWTLKNFWKTNFRILKDGILHFGFL